MESQNNDETKGDKQFELNKQSHLSDNHKDHNPEDQFWKFALTGSSNNTEIKLWSCEHWTCLQTVQIKPNDGKRTELKAELDLTAQYLLLSDIHRKNVYVLQLEISNDKVQNFT